MKRHIRYIRILFLVPIILAFMCMILLALISKDKSEKPRYESAMGLSGEVQIYRDVVYETAAEYGIQDYSRYLLAIMQVESGGRGIDVMQCLASSGLPENKWTTDASIEYACMYFAKLLKRAKAAGVDMETVIQSYNYGMGYIDYIAADDKKHTYLLACSFAANKSNGVKVVYNNPMAVKMNGGWRYAYGNMFYVYLVKQYLAVDPLSADVSSAIISEAVKYKGYPYVWGGASPSTSFDCSGLVQWCYGSVGIVLPHNAQAQYDMVQHITLEEAQPGDLIFFTETTGSGNFITHVGIYVGDNRMFHAGNPLGYADLTSKYWRKHFVCAGRIYE